MFRSQTQKLNSDIDTIKAAFSIHDLLHSRVSGPSSDDSSASALDFDIGISHTLNSADWKIYNHCAALTRLYALYEQFVFELMDEWIKRLPQLYRQYVDLPEDFRKSYRLGVAEVLSKLAVERYQGLTELNVIQGLHDALYGSSSYELLSDALLINDRNLRPEVVEQLFNRIGIKDSWSWVRGHPEMKRIMKEEYGEGSHADSELRTFIRYRNQTAHGTPEDILGLAEVKKTCNLVGCICTALAQLVTKSTLDRLQLQGQAVVIGRVAHRYSGNIFQVQAATCKLAVNDEIYLSGHNVCVATTVVDIELNHIKCDCLDAQEGQMVGLKLGHPAKIDDEILRRL